MKQSRNWLIHQTSMPRGRSAGDDFRMSQGLSAMRFESPAAAIFSFAAAHCSGRSAMVTLTSGSNEAAASANFPVLPPTSQTLLKEVSLLSMGSSSSNTWSE